MTARCGALLGVLVLAACSTPAPVDEPAAVAGCVYCALPVDESAPTCETCRASAITRGDQAGAARRRAEVALEERFRVRIPQGVHASLTLLAADDLRAFGGNVPDTSDEPGHHLLAFTEVEELLRDGVAVDLVFRIYLARGTPAAWAEGILAHELFHVWQTLQGGGPSQRDAFREGSAQYVQHEVLEHLGHAAWAERVASDTDPVYGGGLRRFRALVLSKGERGALELATRAEDFPSGY